ncbi:MULTISPECIES: tetraacyldisaccharide 4'-kinase [Flavobacterium]|uniref:Tetraacyldisaccharide 4'-kinase n=1 Tax=Flavobacterium keumense TaxID=1306518 RepID=A0ABY8N4L7_9FLAO|nr:MULTISPECIES: tetraacyldisaccharide 4'-kinase [Flavobacterium]WGK94592.1 tetraacyldisaccharide 4'-kinase [Flavobacterium keumense]
MNLLRKILFPFAILYGFITSIRNFLFDKGFLKSFSFPVPVIVVGNLSIGGTGKTPQIEYLIRLLSERYTIATLSRGYKRKSEGFVLANANATAETLGDEPYQFYQKFPSIQVAVDADRKNGIEQLLTKEKKPQVILLDDAFQHRKVKAGFYILLTAYDDVFADDFLLPTGNLRESRSGAKRTDVIVVTKCPATLSETEQTRIKQRIKLYAAAPVYFSTIAFDDCVQSSSASVPVTTIQQTACVLVAGIAKPDSFFDYLKNSESICLTYPDHHHFTESDIQQIKQQAGDKLIVTTEKDYVRLKDSELKDQLYYLPIRTSLMVDSNEFDAAVLDYLKK